MKNTGFFLRFLRGFTCKHEWGNVVEIVHDEGDLIRDWLGSSYTRHTYICNQCGKEKTWTR